MELVRYTVEPSKPSSFTRWWALLAVLILVALVFLYVREFAVLSNTLGVWKLVTGSMIVALLIFGGFIWRWRDRFTPWDRHLPEVLLIGVFGLMFAPLFGSLLNRGLGKAGFESFEFVSETAYFASGYGILKGEKLSPTGWRLVIKDGKSEHHLKYSRQAYYPLTKPGEPIMLPVRRGLFGIRVVELY